MSSFSKRERKREVSFCFGVVVVVVVFFVVERKREESKVESVVVVLVVVALSRGKESSLGRLSHPLHPKEREREKEEEEENTQNAQQRVFFGLFFRLFFVVFLAKQKPAKIVSFPLECDPKTKRGTV